MRTLLIKTKNDSEYRFITGLLKKLGLKPEEVSIDELEDIALSRALKNVDRTKKVKKSEILKKLQS